jgi:hypothetical protein
MTRDSSTDRRWTRRVAGAAVGALVFAGACGGTTSATSSTSDAQPAARSSTHLASGLVGKRYCEVLLAHLTSAGVVATVYNTYPLNACPESQWAAMDAAAIAKENAVPFALLNGPRYWLMDSIAKVSDGTRVVKTFGGMAMIEEATVVIGTDLAAAMAPFSVHAVSRQAAFTFRTGRQVYELHDPSGQTWVMQTYSQSKDPNLSQADLPGLASRLTLPAGWTYRPRTLTRPLVVATTVHAAHVLQDNLQNSYSLETGG